MIILKIRIDHLCNLARLRTSHTVLTMPFIMTSGKIHWLYCWNIKANWDKVSFQSTLVKNAKQVTFSRIPSPNFCRYFLSSKFFQFLFGLSFQIQLFSKVICKYRNFFVGSWDRPPSPSSLFHFCMSLKVIMCSLIGFIWITMVKPRYSIRELLYQKPHTSCSLTDEGGWLLSAATP